MEDISQAIELVRLIQKSDLQNSVRTIPHEYSIKFADELATSVARVVAQGDTGCAVTFLEDHGSDLFDIGSSSHAKTPSDYSKNLELADSLGVWYEPAFQITDSKGEHSLFISGDIPSGLEDKVTDFSEKKSGFRQAAYERMTRDDNYPSNDYSRIIYLLEAQNPIIESALSHYPALKDEVVKLTDLDLPSTFHQKANAGTIQARSQGTQLDERNQGVF